MKSPRDTERVEKILEALKSARKVAILRLGSVGDVIATLPFAWLLREVLPQSTTLAWIAHPAEAKLLEGVAVLDEILPLPRSSIFSAIPAWRKKLRGAAIDALFDLHANLKSAIVSLGTGAPVRIGLDPADCRERWNALISNYKLPRLSSGNKTRRALEIAALLGHPGPCVRFGLRFTSEERRRGASVLEGLQGDGRPVAVLQLGRFEDVRSWPPENYAALAGELAKKGRGVLVLGGPKEVHSGNIVKSLLSRDDPSIRFEVGTLGLREVGALLDALSQEREKEHVFLGPDSGCLHLSAACGLRTIGLHGPHPPERTAPVGPNFEALYHPEAADCIPCGRRECVHEVESFCMKSISTGEVLEEMLERHSPERRVDPLPSPSTQGKEGRAAPGYPSTAPLWRTGEGLQAAILAFLPFLIALSGPQSLLLNLLPALSCGGMVLLTYLFGRSLGGHLAGLLSALSLLSMQGFLRSSSLALFELVPAFLVTASGFFYHQMDRNLRSDGRRLKLERWAGPLGIAATGAAVIFGGIEGLFLPLASVIAFHAGERNLPRLLQRRALLFFLSSAAIAAASLLLFSLADGHDALKRALGGSSTPEASASAPYLVLIATDALPASLLFPFLLFSHFKVRRFREDLGFADRRWRFPKAALFAGLMALMLLRGEAPLDLLFLYPMLALLTGSWLERKFLDRVKPW